MGNAVESLREPYRADWAGVLRSSFLFRNIPLDVLERVEERLECLRVVAGDPVFLEHEKSDRVYFIASGQVEIVKYKPLAGSMQRIVIFEAGESFSELSILTQSQHSTSAFAVSDAELLQLDRQTFFALMEQYPQIGSNLIQSLALLNHQVLHEKRQIDYYREGLLQISSQLTRLLPFNFIELYQVLPVSYHQGYLLVALKDPTNPSFYKAFRNLHPELRIKVCLISEKDFQMLRKTIAPYYSGHQFTVQSPARRESPSPSDPMEFLRGMSAFTAYAPEDLNHLLKMCQIRTLKAGELLYQAEEESRFLYIVVKGDIELRIPQSGGGSRFIAHAAAGEMLGEVSFLTKMPHSLSARASLDSLVIEIGPEIFARLIGDSRFVVELAQTLAKRLQRSNQLVRQQDALPHLHIEKIAQLSGLLPHHLLEKHRMLPIDLEGNTLVMGIVHADSDHIYSLLHRYVGHLRVELVLISDKAYQEGARALLQTSPTRDFGQVSLTNIQRQSKDIIGDVDLLIATASRWRASDIHIEMQDDGLVFRLRIDGLLQELVEKVSIESGRQILNRLKVMANLDIAESRLPQDGHISLAHLQLEDCPAARLSLVPTVHGEKAVIRLHKNHVALLPLELLTPDRATVLKLKEVVEARDGVCLVAGPTGSGKTSTLYGILKALNRIDRHIVSVEDPVEALIPGVTQIPVVEEIGRTFEAVLRHILRQDPDIIMIGEMRDKTSAHMCFEAAITGHLVLTTVHAIDSLAALPRLTDLGVNRETLSSGLHSVLSQRLLRAICPECRSERACTVKEQEVFRRYGPQMDCPSRVSFGQGCLHCRYTGYFDRLAVFELWQKTPELQSCWMEQAPMPKVLQVLREAGFQPLREAGLRLAAQGLTTIEEVLRQCPKPPA